MQTLKTGPGTEKGLDMGDLANAAHRDKVAGYTEQGEAPRRVADAIEVGMVGTNVPAPTV
ncbi:MULTISPECIES: hypothetical protein [unclassified Halomonas]|uniref:hypothetical protein n=1 Tax=unclassified Halomonas TaxID=2609666 RepID=UPI0024690899|nr:MULTISPECIES: hypothetical protein [unclassified Halomonas]